MNSLPPIVLGFGGLLALAWILVFICALVDKLRHLDTHYFADEGACVPPCFEPSANFRQNLLRLLLRIFGFLLAILLAIVFLPALLLDFAWKGGRRAALRSSQTRRSLPDPTETSPS